MGGVISEWTNNLPIECGKFWFWKENWKPRIVSVWVGYYNQEEFLTNEDGGAPVTDKAYHGGYWQGPIVEPEPPEMKHLNVRKQLIETL